MHRPSYLPFTLADIKIAIETASKGRKWREEVKDALTNIDAMCLVINKHLSDGTWRDDISYYQLTKRNNNKKLRYIDAPRFKTLVYEHLLKNKLEPIYMKRAPLVSLNCKVGCGITPQSKKKASNSNYVLPRVKHLFYDLREFEWGVCADQRQCYAHIKPSVFRKQLKRLIGDKSLIDFATELCFVNGKLPVGTPTSPLAHHILMLSFHRWLCENTEWRVCYADNCFVACRTREEANQLKWRIRQFWWYELQIRAKRGDTRIFSLSDDRGFDFCGFRVFRLPNKSVIDHNKGYCKIRRSTFERSKACTNNKSWASYFGLLRHTDSFAEMLKIEETMKLSALTSKIKINRKMDAPNVAAKDLVKYGIKFDILDYEIRRNEKSGEPNWVKLLISMPETDENGNPTGRNLARECHGSMASLVNYLVEVETNFGGKKNILPIEDVELEQQCGYIFKGSTNQMQYID